MTAAELLAKCQALGLTVQVKDERLVVTPKARLTEALRSELKRHRAALIDELERQQAEAVSAAEIGPPSLAEVCAQLGAADPELERVYPDRAEGTAVINALLNVGAFNPYARRLAELRAQPVHLKGLLTPLGTPIQKGATKR
jgi:hypothetical protein